MLEKSKLVPIMHRICRRLGAAYCAYGDPAYPQGAYLAGPFKHTNLNVREARFNRKMSANRIPNEWGFGKIKLNFSYLDFEKRG